MVKSAVPAVKENVAPPRRYAAPALEKGLDLLEILAAEPGGLAQKQLALRLERSVSEIFRMLDVLQRRGYVARNALTGHYSLTLKLFALANSHQPTRRLQLSALPIMQDLAERIGQSCHLVVASENRIVVVAQAEPHAPMTFSVKLGADFPLSERRVSARVLTAFASEARRAEMIGAMLAHDHPADSEPLRARIRRIAADGYDIAPSETVDGVTDLCFPVFDHTGEAKAALTVPVLPLVGRTPGAEIVIRRARDAAARITATIGGVRAEDRPLP